MTVQPVASAHIHTPTTFVPALEGMRGAAILAVLLFHTGNLSGGFLGVDLFFVLSGYFITRLLLQEVGSSGRVSLTGFWIRRVRRLFPALAAMVVAVTLLVWATGPPDLVRSTLSDGPWVQASLLNWHLLAESASYWDRFGAERVFAHLWSIAVEEQFYFIWPLVVFIIARMNGRVSTVVAIVATVFAVASVGAMAALVSGADSTRAYTGTDTRAFSLLLGAVISVPAVSSFINKRVGRWAGALLGFLSAVILTSWFLVDGVNSVWLFAGGLLAHSVLSAVVIALCVHRPSSRFSGILAWRPLRWLGAISYSLYLWHWPIIVFLSPEATGLRGWTLTILVSGVSIVLAVLSKCFIEDPIRRRKALSRGHRGYLIFALAMAGLALLWLLLPGPVPTQIDISDLS